MSKYQGFENFKIIKKCEDTEKVSEPKIEKCENFKIPEGNFLENVNDEILYVNDKIKIKKEENVEKSTENFEQIKKISANIPPDCFSDFPAKLGDQIPLPISNIEILSFYETFMISKHVPGTRLSNPIIPDIHSTDEIGSSSVIIEEMENGNILIFITQQIYANCERKVIEILSVITKDLKLVHEKIIERKCSEDKNKVKMRRNLLL